MFRRDGKGAKMWIEMTLRVKKIGHLRKLTDSSHRKGGKRQNKNERADM